MNGLVGRVARIGIKSANFGILTGSIQAFTQDVEIGLRDDVITRRRLRVQPSHRRLSHRVRSSQPHQIPVGRPPEIVEVDGRPAHENRLPFLRSVLIEDRLQDQLTFRVPLEERPAFLVALQRSVGVPERDGSVFRDPAHWQSGLPAGGRPGFIKTRDAFPLRISEKWSGRKAGLFRPDAVQQGAQFLSHGKTATLFILGLARLQPNFSDSIQVNMAERQNPEHLPVAPAGDVGESGRRNQMRGQVPADRLELLGLEKSFADGAAAEHRDLRNDMHLGRSRVLRQQERPAGGLELALDRVGGGVLAPAVIGVAIEIRGGQVCGAPAQSKKGQQMQPVPGIDIRLRVQFRPFVVIHDIGTEFGKADRVGLGAGRDPLGNFTKADSQNALRFGKGFLGRCPADGFKLLLAFGVRVVDATGAFPARRDPFDFHAGHCQLSLYGMPNIFSSSIAPVCSGGFLFQKGMVPPYVQAIPFFLEGGR